MTTSTILYRIDTWFLRRQRIDEYAILTLTGYQQHYAMQADILPDIGTMSIWWNFPSTSRRSFKINRYQPTSLANINEKHHFDIVSIKASLCWTDISADIKWYKYYPIPLRTRYRPVDVRNRTSTPDPRWICHYDIVSISLFLCRVDIAPDVVSI